jgi:hypothetical protein
VSECIYNVVHSIITKQPVPLISSYQDNPSEYLIEAYQEQTQIGWNQFCKGRWSKEWEAIFRYDLRFLHPVKKYTPEGCCSKILETV